MPRGEEAAGRRYDGGRTQRVAGLVRRSSEGVSRSGLFLVRRVHPGALQTDRGQAGLLPGLLPVGPDRKGGHRNVELRTLHRTKGGKEGPVIEASRLGQVVQRDQGIWVYPRG